MQLILFEVRIFMRAGENNLKVIDRLIIKNGTNV
jgi:hypothetical protein